MVELKMKNENQHKKDEKLFIDTIDAAKKLLEIMPLTRMQEDDWLLVAISADAVEMVEYMAEKLKLSYDVLFTEKILAPNNPECAIAMVSETQELIIHNELTECFDINIEYVYGEAHRRYEESILKYVYKYRKGHLINSLENRNILFVDKGCESGLSILTSVKTAIKANANSVMFAVSVMPSSLDGQLAGIMDEIYTNLHVENFIDTDFYFQDNKQINADDVLEILENSKHYLPLQKTKTGEENE